VSDDHEVRGLNLVRPGAESNPRVARIREQLRANDAWNKNEPDAAEPPTVSAVRRRAEHEFERQPLGRQHLAIVVERAAAELARIDAGLFGEDAAFGQ